MIAARTFAALLVLHATPWPGFGASVQNQPMGTISLRKRLHINTLITEPGTVEIDWGSPYSISSATLQMPLVVKYTPRGRHIIWGRTEYNVAFDSLTRQAVTFTATSVLIDGLHLDIAIAPQATFLIRDDSGARLGATGIARYDGGHSSVGVTVGWSAATHSSPTNPAGVFDLGFGFGQNLPGSATLEKFTPHCNVVWERATGRSGALSMFEGVEYQMTARVAFDLSAQHFGVNSGTPDHQIVLGVTINFGKLQ